MPHKNWTESTSQGQDKSIDLATNWKFFTRLLELIYIKKINSHMKVMKNK